MNIKTIFPDYTLVDTGDGEKLERFGRYVVRRPEPQAIWRKSLANGEWLKADASFLRDSKSEERGEWKLKRRPILINNWEATYFDFNQEKILALAEKAKAIGAVNTIVRSSDGSLCGYNTDYFGFSYMMRKSGIELCGKNVIILGTGGASLATLYALKKLGERERHIIEMRFYRARTQMEVAADLGISQAQVSRLEKGAIDKLRKLMQ